MSLYTETPVALDQTSLGCQFISHYFGIPNKLATHGKIILSTCCNHKIFGEMTIKLNNPQCVCRHRLSMVYG